MLIIVGKSEKIIEIGPETAEIEQSEPKNGENHLVFGQIWGDFGKFWDFEILTFLQFLGSDSSISAVSGRISMVFSLFLTAVSTLNNLQHFSNTLES